MLSSTVTEGPSMATTKTDLRQHRSDDGKDQREKFTPFYGKDSPFSQHYMCSFIIDEIEYNCAEQYMMYSKAVLFKDMEMAEEIMKSKNPREQKKLGRSVQNFDVDTWNKECEEVVRKANLSKFSQNKDIKKELLATKGRTLVEASPRDRKWGVGLGVKNPKVHCRKTWRGKNLLGQILTSVRDQLAEEEAGKTS